VLAKPLFLNPIGAKILFAAGLRRVRTNNIKKIEAESGTTKSEEPPHFPFQIKNGIILSVIPFLI